MHRYTKADVREAFKVYQEVTGDVRASLQIWSPGDKWGTRFEIANGATSLGGRTYCGAEEATRFLKLFVCGYLDGKKAAK